MDRRAYILWETGINAVLNTVMGMLVFLLLFGGQRDVAIWGTHGLVMDCVPQGFMTGVMSVVPPAVLTRVRIAKTKISGVLEPIGALVGRTLLCGIATMVGLTALATAIAYLSSVTRIGFGSGLTLKALASLILVSILTPPLLRIGLDRMGVRSRPY